MLSCVCFIVCYCIQLSFNFHSYFDLFIIVKRQKISTHYWNNSLNKSSCIICWDSPNLRHSHQLWSSGRRGRSRDSTAALSDRPAATQPEQHAPEAGYRPTATQPTLHSCWPYPRTGRRGSRSCHYRGILIIQLDDVQVFNSHFPFICTEFEDMQTCFLQGALEQLAAMQDCLFLFFTYTLALPVFGDLRTIEEGQLCADSLR